MFCNLILIVTSMTQKLGGRNCLKKVVSLLCRKFAAAVYRDDVHGGSQTIFLLKGEGVRI